ncbi:MAG: hypothetical protein M1826_007233 [Phylliscum demangeonii]|nr:MAG: hypothetical protein M1826_007233 [Phylliscum demangeonii]
MANVTAKGGYRADLRPEAVARSSAILRSQRKVKDVSDKKKKALEAMAKAKARVRGGKGGGAKVAEEKTKS